MTEKRISLKTVNNETLLGTGNIDVATEIDIDSDWVSNSENPVQSKVIKSALDSKSSTGHTHSTTDITNLSIPSASSTVPSADTTNGSVGTGTTYARSNHTHPKSSIYAESEHTHSQYLTEHQSLANYVTTSDSRLSDERTPKSHTHGNLQNNGQVGSTIQANKNVVTDSNGLITTEDKPTIPSASSTTPSADTTNGSVGTGTTWARSNHTHPKSSLYAESNHTHSQYLTSHQDITGKEDKSNKVTSLDGFSTDTEYPSAKCVYDEIWTDLYGTIQNDYVSNNSLGNVAFSNDYDDLDNLPQFGNLAFENDVDLSGHDLDELSDNTNLLFSGDYDDLDNKPSIPTHTSDLTNDSGFLTQHQSLTNYLQKTDVKDNLTSTDTDKPLSAKQGKELKTLIDNKPTVTVDSTWVANSTNPIQSKEIKTALDGKANVIDFYYDNLTDELVINTSTETDFEDLILKEDKSNKVSSWSNTPDNNHYPTEKLVKDYIDEMIGDILEYINS